MSPDLVVPCRAGGNEELRIAIRSWHANLDYRHLAVAGGAPDWLTNVDYLPVPQRINRPATNALAALKALVRRADLTDDVIVLNDDMYVTQPVAHVGQMHRGPLDAALEDIRARYPRHAYARAMTDTAAMLVRMGLARPLCYDALHVPMLLNRGQLQETFAAIAADQRVHHTIPSWVDRIHWKTVHGNLHRLGGDQVDDVKVRDLDEQPVWPAPYVSTDDRSFTTGAIGRHLRALFPDPSPYER